MVRRVTGVWPPMTLNFLAQFFQRNVFRKISVKLALVITLMVTVLISAFGLALTHLTREVLESNVKNSHREIGVRVAEGMAMFVMRPVELLATPSQLIGKTRADAWAQETVLVEMAVNHPMFEKIVSVNSLGEEIASSNPGFSKESWGRTTAFRAAMRGKKYVSPISIGANHLPYMVISMPYFELGKVTGVLIAKVNMRGIWDIVDGIRIGETGSVFLISEKGLILAHPDKKLVFKNISINADPVLQKLIAGEVNGVELEMQKGKRLLMSYAPVQAALPLGVIVQIETREAYHLLNRMRTLVGCLLYASIGLSLGVSFLLSGWLVRPVRSLQNWSKKIAMGDFDYHLAPKSSDEIGRLFIMFKRMGERLKAARERERLAAFGEVVTSISHKLKNSIVSLKTFAQVLPQRRRNEQFMERFQEKFSSTVAHLEKLFVSLSQIASSNTPEREPLRLSFILESLRDHYEETTQENGIDFRLETEDDLPLLLGDQEQFKELFSNLIQNAIQAMPDGGIVTIKAFSVHEPPMIRVSIRDTGRGIPDTHVRNIFKPFFTTKSEGMGLGLSVSKKIVEDHQGSLTLAAHGEEGCTFQILFPVPSQPISPSRESFTASSR